MFFKNKYRVLIWIGLILLATNLALAVSFFIHVNNDRIVELEVEGETEVMPSSQRVFYFREKLGLTDQQIVIFRDLNRYFNRNARQITMQLETLRLDMVRELGEQNPDVARLDTITMQIGRLHTQLKNLTVEYYLGMKEASTPEQQQILHQIFMSVLNKNEDLGLPQRGGRFIRNNE